jgi:hypothetical protein
VLVLCNGARPDVVAFAQRQVAGARVFVSPVNLGFGGGNDRLAREARGELLLLLNDDAQVEAGWLEPLVQTLDEHPDAAAVGSRILFPDGRVQEAGSVLFDDGSTAPSAAACPRAAAPGPSAVRSTSPRRTRCCCAGRRTSRWAASTSASTRPTTRTWTSRSRCAPPVALALRRPLADPAPGVVQHHDALQALAVRPQHRPHPGQVVSPAGRPAVPPAGRRTGRTRAVNDPPARRAGPRQPAASLVVDDMLPLPGLGAGMVLMHELAREAGLDRYALSMPLTKHPGADPTAVAELGLEVVEGPLDRHLATTPYDCVVGVPAVELRPGRRALPEGTPVVYVAEALFSARLEREAAGSPTTTPRRSDLLAEATETRAPRSATSGPWTGSPPSQWWRPRCCARCRAALRWTPSRRCSPTCGSPRRRSESRADLAFVASWTARGHTPNSDAFWWLAREVLPHVLPPVPWTRLRVTGHHPPDDIADAAGPHITLTGFLPELADLYATTRVVVAPDRFGAGLKIKTLEALQYGVPVVATTIGAQGIEVPPGLSPMVVTDDPAEFAAAVVTLLTDNDAWRARRADVEALHAHWQDRPGTSWPDVVDAVLPDSVLSRKAPR